MNFVLQFAPCVWECSDTNMLWLIKIHELNQRPILCCPLKYKIRLCK